MVLREEYYIAASCNFIDVTKLKNHIIFCAVWLTYIYIYIYIIIIIIFASQIYGIRAYSQQCEHMHEIDIGANKQMRAKGELV